MDAGNFQSYNVVEKVIGFIAIWGKPNVSVQTGLEVQENHFPPNNGVHVHVFVPI